MDVNTRTVVERRQQLADALDNVARGDRTALRGVYDASSAKLMGVILQIVCDREQAEDVLQEVFVKVWHRAGRFDAGRASPITWLCAIARNAAIDEVRKHGRGREFGADVLPDVEDEAMGAEEALCNEEDRVRLQKCLEVLQEDHRTSIRLAFFRGLTHTELAERIGVPLGTMKSWIRRGLKSLRGCLSDG